MSSNDSLDGIKSTKRNRSILSIEEELEIINRLEEGESVLSLQKAFRITNLKSKKDTILRFASKLRTENGSKRRKTMKTAENKELEKSTYAWYLERKNKEAISAPVMGDKAIELNTRLGGSPNFKDNSGELHQFKSHRGIHESGETKGFISSNKAVPEEYKEKMLTFLKSEDYSFDDLYNDTDLYWKSLPIESLQTQCEDQITIKETKDASLETNADEASEGSDESGPSHEEALTSLQIVITWFEQQQESSITQLLLLKRIQDLAMKKFVRENESDYFLKEQKHTAL